MTCICDTRVCISQEFMETWRPELKLFVMIVDNWLVHSLQKDKF